MAGMFTIGETKARPGVYSRYENAGGPDLAGATNGIGAAVVKANWGPLNKLVDLEGEPEIGPIFGKGETVDTIEELFNGGAILVKAVRVGSGGTESTISLKDDAEADVVSITGKYVGNRPFSVTIRDALIDDTKKECMIYSGTTEFEKVEFEKGGNEPEALAAAFAKSKNFVAKKLADGTGELADVAQAEMTPGTNPTTDIEAYSKALNVLEASKWNVLCVDTEDATIHALVQPFINRIYQAGAWPMVVLAGGEDLDLEQRMTNAAAFNDEKVHYVLNKANAGDELYEGYRLAARIGGMIAAIPSNQSLTHEVVRGLTSLEEPLTNTEVVKALGRGCLVLTVNSSGQIWIESGINTLITPSGNQDEGWKKIRRTKTRFELMDRITATTDKLIGKINNDSDGRSTFMQAAQGVINTMIGEKKLLEGGSIYEDQNNPPAGDSAWFVIAVDDIDSIERAYLTYRFRFSPNR